MTTGQRRRAPRPALYPRVLRANLPEPFYGRLPGLGREHGCGGP